MSDFFTAVQYAVRGLRKSPGFTFGALAILTLGIGANTAMFSVVNAVLLNPVPFPDPERIVSVFHVPPAKAFPGMSTFAVSIANYLDWKKESSAFEEMSAIGGDTYLVGGDERPQSIVATRTEPSFFSVVGVRPAYGRAFTGEENVPGRDRVVVLSHGFAESYFGSAAGAVGRNLNMSGETRRVIGVMPRTFQVKSWFPASTEVIVPLAWTTEDRSIRSNHNILVVGRLRDGVSVREAQTQLDVISKRLEKAWPEENTGWGAVVTTLRDHLVGEVQPALLTLLGAVGFVLLIACANTANLVLARTISRRKELAIRAAMGASASQVVRPVLVETTLLAVVGGLLGLLLAKYGASLVLGALANQLPPNTQVRVDGLVLAFTLTAAVATGLAAGFIGAWRLMKVDLNEALKQGGKTDAEGGRGRTRNALVTAEVALSLVLLVGAGLMIRSFAALRSVDPGFEPQGVITMNVPIPTSGNKERTRLYDEFLPQVRRLPGVVSAGAVDVLPLAGGGSQQPIVVEGRPAEVFALQPNVSVRRITTGYMSTMRIPIVAGRDITEQDTTGTRAVVLISESMAKRYWRDGDAVGKRLTISFTKDIVREVVGIVGDVKETGLNALEPIATLYEPVMQNLTDDLTLVVRATGDPNRLVPDITRVLRGLGPELAVRDADTLDKLVASSLSQQRFGMYLFAALAVLALLLAAVGIFSVLAYSLRSRIPEIGIRMALGARVHDVVRMVVFEGMRPTVAGIAVGMLAAYALSGILSCLIYGVSATDRATFATVAGVLAAVALMACAIPAWRAAGVEPARVLRNE